MTNVVVLQIFTSRLDEGNVLGFLDVISFGSTRVGEIQNEGNLLRFLDVISFGCIWVGNSERLIN
jgi:hypothetical protein